MAMAFGRKGVGAVLGSGGWVRYQVGRVWC